MRRTKNTMYVIMRTSVNNKESRVYVLFVRVPCSRVRDAAEHENIVRKLIQGPRVRSLFHQAIYLFFLHSPPSGSTVCFVPPPTFPRRAVSSSPHTAFLHTPRRQWLSADDPSLFKYLFAIVHHCRRGVSLFGHHTSHQHDIIYVYICTH